MKQSLAWLASALAFAVLLSCTTTTKLRPEKEQQVSGFFGDDYHLLQPGAEGQLAMRYIAPGIDWKQYKGTVLEPVQFWAGSDSKVKPDAQMMLSTYFYNSLKASLEKVGINLVELPGPGIMRAQVALTDVTEAVPVLRTVSVIVPQARVLNQAQQLYTGSYGFSGAAEVGIKITDSRTGQLLGAAIDRRGGGGGAQQAAVWQWGDAQAAIDFWTQRCAEKVVELRDKAKEQ